MLNWIVSVTIWLSLGLFVWPWLDDSMIRLYLKILEKFLSHFPGQILGCTYTICPYGQIWNFPSGSPSPTQLCLVYTLFLLIYSVHLLCDWSFRLYQHIVYIYYLVVYCLFLLWHSPYGVICAAIRRDSVSLLRCPFLYHVQVFSCEISFVCRLKYPTVFLSFHFCFLVIFHLMVLVLSVLFLVTVISLPPRFFFVIF